VPDEVAERDLIGAVARRQAPNAFKQEIVARDHRLLADEPRELGGDDGGPTPQELLAASLASCIAVTLEMYARRKGWTLDSVEVQARYARSKPGEATHFEVVLRLPDNVSEEQRERLSVIAGKCPVHRILEGEVTFEERLEVAAPART
jgi:putative redox protein